MNCSKSIRSMSSALFIATLVLGLTSTSAVAATTTAPIAVSATVVAACSVTVSTGGVSFGNYTATAASASTATLTLQCTNGNAYTVGLNGGTSGSVTARTMMNGTTPLNYVLTTDSAHLSNWGNTTGTWVSGSGNGNTQTLTVYGQIPANQFVTAGSYTDSVTATVTY